MANAWSGVTIDCLDPGIHLDVTVDDIESSIATVVRLGGRETGQRHDYDEGVVVVMADPEDHEFCLVQYLDRGGRG